MSERSVSRRYERDSLDQVRALQAALLQLLDSLLTPAGKSVAARRLLGRARETDAPELTLRAMEWVLGQHLDEMTRPNDGFGSRPERRVLDLHRVGEHTCRRCLLPLPDRTTVARWQRERALAAAWRDWIREHGEGRSA